METTASEQFTPETEVISTRRVICAMNQDYHQNHRATEINQSASSHMGRYVWLKSNRSTYPKRVLMYINR